METPEAYVKCSEPGCDYPRQPGYIFCRIDMARRMGGSK
jgi:hypothetical protein